ncbi:hypothetical protein COLO4_33172 [Corchorus olitorius]|uniref:Uncharacterized protein n=1 Tax=Corchorus olitorius TaxID=93759 RepID=A0A1R3GVR6_9ROSI|nr:hypothetical protein COLO4_33172 [Corchorus olitorius]
MSLLSSSSKLPSGLKPWPPDCSAAIKAFPTVSAQIYTVTSFQISAASSSSRSLHFYGFNLKKLSLVFSPTNSSPFEEDDDLIYRANEGEEAWIGNPIAELAQIGLLGPSKVISDANRGLPRQLDGPTCHLFTE